jgi:dihydroorotate dehydrogenase (fumarate)/dihydroorotate dehydrogenase
MLTCEFAGLCFANPIGLAAGWDKSGHALRMLDAMGFGFAEIGSISSRPSAGNPKPRLFRLPQDLAIVVNYGLPNDGAEIVSTRLAVRRAIRPLGVNIVKTNDGPDAGPCSDDEIFADYARSVSLLHTHAGYVMLNLSCPNAKGGTDFFAQRGNIRRLLEQLAPLGLACPVFLKIAPRDDRAEHERLLLECDGFDFVRGFCFNLASGNPHTHTLSSPRASWEGLSGAVSGKPVEALINRCIAGLYAQMDHRRYIIIGTGGVFTAEDAYLKFRLGASLVQLYTAMVYEGPGVVKRICRGLVEQLTHDGFQHVSQAVGTAHSRSV